MRIAILDDYTSDAAKLADWSKLSNEVEVIFFHEHFFNKQNMIEILKDFDILAVMRERTIIDREVLESLPKLKFIVTSGMANAAIDMHAAHELKIIVSGTESSGISTTEQTWALILGLTHRIVPEHNNIFQNKWQQGLARELYGKNLGLIGLGRIGVQVANIGKAFGMNVLAWSQNLDKAFAESQGVTYVSSKNELCKISDVLSLHVRLSERTENLINSTELSVMKKDAYLINTSRGQIVNEAALIYALERKIIAGAGLDVFNKEPLPLTSPLIKLDNLLLSPHLGYGTVELMKKFYSQILEDIEAFLNEEPIRLII